MIAMHCNAVATATLIYVFIHVRYPSEKTEKHFEIEVESPKSDHETYNEKDLENLREIR